MTPHGQDPYDPAARQPSPPVPYGPLYQPVYMQRPPTSGVAVASLVLGIVGVFTGWCLFALPCVVAVVLGHMGLAETRSGQKEGRGLAVAGLVLGYVILAPAILFALYFFGVITV